MARADAIAHIINGQWPFLEQHCNAYQLRIFHAIRRCRTPALGGQLYACDSCGKQHYRYNLSNPTLRHPGRSLEAEAIPRSDPKTTDQLAGLLGK